MEEKVTFLISVVLLFKIRPGFSCDVLVKAGPLVSVG